jgi:hypothetical protein
MNGWYTRTELYTWSRHIVVCITYYTLRIIFLVYINILYMYTYMYIYVYTYYEWLLYPYGVIHMKSSNSGMYIYVWMDICTYVHICNHVLWMALVYSYRVIHMKSSHCGMYYILYITYYISGIHIYVLYMYTYMYIYVYTYYEWLLYSYGVIHMKSSHCGMYIYMPFMYIIIYFYVISLTIYIYLNAYIYMYTYMYVYTYKYICIYTRTELYTWNRHIVVRVTYYTLRIIFLVYIFMSCTCIHICTYMYIHIMNGCYIRMELYTWSRHIVVCTCICLLCI